MTGGAGRVDPATAPAGAVVLGEALVDMLQSGPEQYRAAVGGAPLNVAVGLARLGAPVEYLGSLGDDALAERILRFLADAGVGTAGVLRVPVPTTLALASFEGAQPDFRFYGSPPSYGLLGAADVDPAMIAGAGVLYCGSIALLCEPVLAAARRAWATPGPLRAFDPNVRPRLLVDPGGLRRLVDEFARRADLVKLSDADAAVLYPGASVVRVVDLLTRAGAGTVVVTRGAAGTVVGHRGELAEVPAPRITAVDTTGAGDSLMAALLYGLLRRGGVPDDVAGWVPLVEFANRVAALVCEAPGGATAMPTVEQVRRRFPD